MAFPKVSGTHFNRAQTLRRAKANWAKGATAAVGFRHLLRVNMEEVSRKAENTDKRAILCGNIRSICNI